MRADSLARRAIESTQSIDVRAPLYFFDPSSARKARTAAEGVTERWRAQ